MDRPSLYDDDIATWAEEQAAALRALGARAELSNAVDWENVAEEIESVGRSQVRAVESLLVQTLAHLLRRLSAPTVAADPHWRSEITAFQTAARRHFEPSMRRRLDWDRVWTMAVLNAEAGLVAYGNALLPGLPPRCPIPLDEVVTDAFDIDAAALRLAQATRPR